MPIQRPAALPALALLLLALIAPGAGAAAKPKPGAKPKACPAGQLSARVAPATGKGKSTVRCARVAARPGGATGGLAAAARTPIGTLASAANAKALRRVDRMRKALVPFASSAPASLVANGTLPGRLRATAARTRGGAVSSDLGTLRSGGRARVTGELIRADDQESGEGIDLVMDADGKEGKVAIGANVEVFASRCPNAIGQVDGTYKDVKRVRGETAVEGGRVVWTYTETVEGTYRGNVGSDAKLQTLDMSSIHGTIEVHQGLHDAKTGKLLKHLPTRTFRTYYVHNAIPIDTTDDTDALVDAELPYVTVHGPHGSGFKGQDELDNALKLVGGTIASRAVVQAALKRDQHVWNEDMACAKATDTADVPHTKKGGTVRYTGTIVAADGEPTDGVWTAASTCKGDLSPGTATGASATFTAADARQEWSKENFSCTQLDVTSPAGRARAERSVDVLGYRLRFTTRYEKPPMDANGGDARYEVRADVPLSDDTLTGSAPVTWVEAYYHHDTDMTNQYCGTDSHYYEKVAETKPGKLDVLQTRRAADGTFSGVTLLVDPGHESYRMYTVNTTDCANDETEWQDRWNLDFFNVHQSLLDDDPAAPETENVYRLKLDGFTPGDGTTVLARKVFTGEDFHHGKVTTTVEVVPA